MGAIFTGSADKGKAKRDEEAAGGSSSRPAKKNKKDVKQGPKARAPPKSDFFEKKWNGPYPNHTGHANHL